MKELLSLLSSIHPLSEDLVYYLHTTIKAKEVRRRKILLEIGQVCRDIIFIKKGIFKCYYLNGDKQICSWFMKEGDIIASVGSFYSQRPSYECIQAIEDSEILYISYTELQHVYRTYLEFNYIGRVLTENYYQAWDRRLHSLRCQSAMDRYRYLLQNDPDLLRRVSRADLATNLGMRPETLSRVMAKDHI
jgi:CRP-like cAMP-binding protein